MFINFRIISENSHTHICHHKSKLLKYECAGFVDSFMYCVVSVIHNIPTHWSFSFVSRLLFKVLKPIHVDDLLSVVPYYRPLFISKSNITRLFSNYFFYFFQSLHRTKKTTIEMPSIKNIHNFLGFDLFKTAFVTGWIGLVFSIVAFSVGTGLNDVLSNSKGDLLPFKAGKSFITFSSVFAIMNFNRKNIFSLLQLWMVFVIFRFLVVWFRCFWSLA